MIKKGLFIIFFSLMIVFIYVKYSNIERHISLRLQKVFCESETWTLVGFYNYDDGGSRGFHFESENGYEILIFEDHGFSSQNDFIQRYYLQYEMTTNGYDEIEIFRKTLLETEIITLIRACELSDDIKDAGYDGARVMLSLLRGLEERERVDRRLSMPNSVLEEITEEYRNEIMWYK